MSTPDIQPNPPVPPVPPVPAYGEYAAPQHPVVAAPAAPQYPQQPQQQYPQQPGYYVPQPYAAQQGDNLSYYGQPAKRPLRTADMVISIVLLVIGLFGVLYTLATGAVLESAMQQQFDQRGLGTYTPGPSLAVLQSVFIISHVVLYLVVVPLTILLIKKRKISFWLPLTGGAIAALVFWIGLIVFMVSDPTLMATMGSR